MEVAMIFLTAYILGGIPFGYLAGRVVGGIDIREHGSRNTGTTNALRTLGVGTAIAVLVLDLGKGLAPVLIARWLGMDSLYVMLAGVAVVAGHNWSIFLRFRGGRGVATTVGVVLGLAPQVMLIIMLIGISITIITRYVSLGAVIGAILLPILMIGFEMPMPYTAFAILLSAILLWRHRPNIGRLLSGTENKVTIAGRDSRPD